MPLEEGPNVWLEPGDIIQVLSVEDKLLSTDLIRERYEDNWTDGGWCRSFKSQEWMGTAWHYVGKDMSGWVGETYKDYMLFRGDEDLPEKEMRERMSHEIVRIIEI